MRPLFDSILGAATLLALLEFVSQVVALLKEALVAWRFGTSAAMDAYLVAIAIAWLARAWVALPIKQTVIPMFRHDLAQHGDRVAWANTSTLLNNLAVILAVLAVTLGLAAPQLVDLAAPGFDAAAEGKAAALSRIMIVSIVFAGLQGVLSQILFSYRRFLLPGVAGTVENLVVVAALLGFGGMFGISGLAMAVVMGSMAQFLVQLPVLWQKRALYSFRVDLRDARMIEMARLSIPLLITAGGTELARITDRIFASWLPIGSVSALAFANRLCGAANNLCIDTIQQATFPHFTQLSAEQRFATLSRQLFRCLRMIVFLAVPIGVGIAVLGDLIVRLAFQRGAFDEMSVQLTTHALFFYALGFPAVSVSKLLSRTFFGLKDTRTPSKVAVVRLSIKVLLCAVLVRPLAHAGIALAETLSTVLKAALLFVLLPAELKRSEAPDTIRSLARTLTASAVMGTVVYLVKQRIAGVFAIPMELILLVALGAVLYAAITLLIKAEEWSSLFRAFALVGSRLLPSKS